MKLRSGFVNNSFFRRRGPDRTGVTEGRDSESFDKEEHMLLLRDPPAALPHLLSFDEAVEPWAAGFPPACPEDKLIAVVCARRAARLTDLHNTSGFMGSLSGL